MDLFDFCPDRYVPETVAPDDNGQTMTSSTGWTHVARPSAPYQRRFRVKLYGLRWHLDPTTGLFDETKDVKFNARLLEIFYAQHRLWSPFSWKHQHLGDMVCRFASPVSVPAAMQNSGGHVDALEIMLIEHNPGYGRW